MADITNSTYLLDLSKRCIISDTGTKNINGVEIPWTFFGEISDDTMKGIGFKFIEDFKDGTEYTEKEINNVLKPISTGIAGVLSKVSLFKNVKISTENLRDNAIALYTAAQSLLSSDASELAKDLASLDVVPYYHLPMRGTQPKMDVASSGGKLKIEFAYGKCNLFCAKEEVWDPLVGIYSNLFPKMGEPNEHNTISLESNSPVPYPAQITVELFKRAVANMKSGPLKLLFGDETSDKSNVFSVADTLQSVATSLNVSDSEIQFVPLDDKKNEKHDDSKVRAVIKNLKQAFTDDNTPILQDPDLEDFEIEIKNANDFSGYNSLAENIQATAMEKIQEVLASDLSKKIKVNKRKITVKALQKEKPNKFAGAVQVTKGESKSTTSLKGIAAGLINCIPNFVGDVTGDLAEKIKKYSHTIYFGFDSFYTTNLKSLYTKSRKIIKNKDGEEVVDYSDTARISMNSILFKKVSITFDFNHLDEEGYPMSGCLQIEDVWNLLYPRHTVSLRA